MQNGLKNTINKFWFFLRRFGHKIVKENEKKFIKISLRLPKESLNRIKKTIFFEKK